MIDQAVLYEAAKLFEQQVYPLSYLYEVIGTNKTFKLAVPKHHDYGHVPDWWMESAPAFAVFDEVTIGHTEAHAILNIVDVHKKPDPAALIKTGLLSKQSFLDKMTESIIGQDMPLVQAGDSPSLHLQPLTGTQTLQETLKAIAVDELKEGFQKHFGMPVFESTHITPDYSGLDALIAQKGAMVQHVTTPGLDFDETHIYFPDGSHHVVHTEHTLAAPGWLNHQAEIAKVLEKAPDVSPFEAWNTPPGTVTFHDIVNELKEQEAKWVWHHQKPERGGPCHGEDAWA